MGTARLAGDRQPCAGAGRGWQGANRVLTPASLRRWSPAPLTARAIPKSDTTGLAASKGVTRGAPQPFFQEGLNQLLDERTRRGVLTRLLQAIGIALVVAATGCSESITCDCVGEPRLEVSAADGAFLLHNPSTDRDLAVALIVKGSLALLDGDCTNWAPRIAPAASVLIPNDQVIGFFPGAETAVVHWCTLSGNRVLETGLLEAPFS